MMNMWCAQTKKPKTRDGNRRECDGRVAEDAFAQKVLMTSEITPMPGRIMM